MDKIRSKIRLRENSIKIFKLIKSLSNEIINSNKKKDKFYKKW